MSQKQLTFNAKNNFTSTATLTLIKFEIVFYCCPNFFPLAIAKIEIILHDIIEKFEKLREEAKEIDMKKFQLIAESSTEVFSNGNVKFLKEIKAPWIVLFFHRKEHSGTFLVVLCIVERKYCTISRMISMRMLRCS
jgi:hypothetical protein